MKKITLDFLINHRKLSRNKNSFAKSFMIYGYTTKLSFIYDNEADIVKCYLYQSDMDDLNVLDNVILLGIIKTEDQLNNMIDTITREK